MGRSMRVIVLAVFLISFLGACGKQVQDSSLSLVESRWTNVSWMDDVRKGFAAYEARDVGSAASALENAWNEGCRDSLVTYRLAFVLERMQKTERAKKLYQQAGKLLALEYPEHAYVREVWHNLGHIEYRAGKFEEALGLYMQAVSTGKEETPELAFSVGMALRRLQRHAEAIGWFEKADRKDFRTNFYMADVYYELKKLDLAMQAMQRAVEIDPRSTKALGSLAHFWYAISEQREEAGEFQTAQDAIKKSLALYTRAVTAGGTNYSEYRKAAEARVRDLERLKAVASTNGLSRVPVGE